MAGRPRKPEYLKALAGTARADRAHSAGFVTKPITDIPAPPDWLPNCHAVKEWNRLAPMLTTNGVVTELDLGALGHLCAIHGKLVQLWAADETPTGHLIAQYNSLAGAFGLTPVMRAKIPTQKKGSEENPFRAFRS